MVNKSDETSGSSQGPATDRQNNPVVDPTENVKDLSIAQNLLREIEIMHIRELLAARSEFAEKIGTLEQALFNEKFDSQERVRVLTESHRLELKADGEKQLTAALAAAEKAVSEQNKSNTLSTDRAVTGMKELIINNAQLGLATTSALTDKVEDLKGQVAVLVNQRIGANDEKNEHRATSGSTIALISLCVFILVSILTLMVRLT